MNTSMNQNSRFHLIIQGLALIFGLFFILTFAHSMQTHKTKEASIRTRAERIFKQDLANPDHYPTHKVVKLSVALGFANFEGAEQILKELENR